MSKVIVISGTTNGFGKILKDQLMLQYNVASISRSVKEHEDFYSIDYAGDITDKFSVYDFFKRVYNKWGRIDVLINNAGMLGEFKSIEKYSSQELDAIVDINIKGTFFMTQTAIGYMTENDKSQNYIINIGSTRSITGAPNKSLYCMTKFALRGLTQCINAEYTNVYSTIVCPGAFESLNLNNVANNIITLIETPRRNHIKELIIGGQL